nr:MAG TPA: hypothetical protein [Caudoviricetes sp.]
MIKLLISRLLQIAERISFISPEVPSIDNFIFLPSNT